MKYFVVADVHGFYAELETALAQAGFFTEKEPHMLVVCGDLFDRGTEAQRMQEFLCDLQDRGLLLLIRGNHEDLMEEFTEHADRWLKETVLFTHHWRNGTVDTLLQLTGLSLYEACLVPARARERMKATPFFTRLLPAMRDFFETEKYIFTHGWLPSLSYGEGKYRRFLLREDWREADRASWNEARWFNGMLAAACGATVEGKTVVCGHYHTSFGHTEFEGKGSEFDEDADFSPYRAKGVLAIDGCTAASGYVNCVVLEDE